MYVYVTLLILSYNNFLIKSSNTICFLIAGMSFSEKLNRTSSASILAYIHINTPQSN